MLVRGLAAQIEKGEQKIQRRLEIQDALDKKVLAYPHPFQQLKIQYGGSRGKNFTEDEDRYMVGVDPKNAGWRRGSHERRCRARSVCCKSWVLIRRTRTMSCVGWYVRLDRAWVACP